MGVAEIIAELRQAAGLSQAALARAAGLSPSTFSRWERGETLPTPYELNNALDALCVTQKERLEAFLALGGPEANQMLRQSLSADLPHATGELWRTLRLRANLSLTELSAALGVNVSTVSRWERGLTAPSPALTVQALAVLAPNPLEHATLTGGLHSLRRPDASHLSFEDCQEEVGRLFSLALAAASPGMELTLLSRLEELSARAAFDPRFLAPLGDVCNLMGARINELGYPRECLRWCDRGLALDERRFFAKITRAGLIFRKGYRVGKRSQFALLETLSLGLNAPEDAWLRAQANREMASAALALGWRRQAEHLALSAREAADETGKALFVAGADLVWARVLRATDRAEEALDFLPPVFAESYEPLEPPQSAIRHLEWAETLAACREVGAAHDHLRHYYRIVQTYQVISLREETKRAERLLLSAD